GAGDVCLAQMDHAVGPVTMPARLAAPGGSSLSAAALPASMMRLSSRNAGGVTSIVRAWSKAAPLFLMFMFSRVAVKLWTVTSSSMGIVIIPLDCSYLRSRDWKSSRSERELGPCHIL